MTSVTAEVVITFVITFVINSAVTGFLIVVSLQLKLPMLALVCKSVVEQHHGLPVHR